MMRTITTLLGLTHHVDSTHGSDWQTTCVRWYNKTPLDATPQTVTCLWCVAEMHWPYGVTSIDIALALRLPNSVIKELRGNEDGKQLA